MANSKLSALTAATPAGADLVYFVQSGNSRRGTAAQIAALANKTTVGLPNVDNTSDANKPISMATQEALNAKAAAGAVGSSGLTMTAGVLGRESGIGAPVVLSLGSGLSIVAGVLTVTGGQDLSTLLAKASNLSDLASAATARTNLGLTATATATPAGGLSIQSGNLVPEDYIKIRVSNKGETVTAATNYEETTVQRACTVIGAFWEVAPTAPGSSSSQAMPYARRSGTKTSLLSANASLAASAILTDASANLTGTLTLAAGNTVGVDLVSVGTGSSGHIFTLAIRYLVP